MLEPHLVEIKQQEESKLPHPELLACGKLLYTTLYRENRRVATPADAGSKPAWEIFSRLTGEHQASHAIPQPPLG
jgi:hypothetical protein